MGDGPTHLRSRLSREDRQDHILEAAAELFSRKGYQGTTTRAIAQACGINEAILFRFFPTKRDLYEALLDRILHTWREEILPAFSEYDSLPLEESLLKISQAIVEQVHQDPRLIRIMLYSSLESAEYAHGFFRKELPLNQFLEKFFHQRVKRGEIHLTHIPLVVKTFLALLFQYLTMKEIYQSAHYFVVPESQVLSFFVKTLLRGIAT